MYFLSIHKRKTLETANLNPRGIVVIDGLGGPSKLKRMRMRKANPSVEALFLAFGEKFVWSAMKFNQDFANR